MENSDTERVIRASIALIENLKISLENLAHLTASNQLNYQHVPQLTKLWESIQALEGDYLELSSDWKPGFLELHDRMAIEYLEWLKESQSRENISEFICANLAYAVAFKDEALLRTLFVEFCLTDLWHESREKAMTVLNDTGYFTIANIQWMSRQFTQIGNNISSLGKDGLQGV
jgi:hypothetical protein